MSFDETFRPGEAKGHHDAQLEKTLDFVTEEQYQKEQARRESGAQSDIVFIYCIVFPTEPPKISLQNKALKFVKTVKEKTKEDIEDERNALLRDIKAAGFVTELVYSSTGKEILCKIGCNDSRFLQEAENKEYKLELNPLAVQHVLELKVKEIDPKREVTKPRLPVYLGYSNYDEEMFDKIQHLGGDQAMPLFLRSNFEPEDAENYKIDLATAKKTFKDQSRLNPFEHLHLKYDKEWEERIIREHMVQLYRTYNDGTILRTADRITLAQLALAAEKVRVNGVRGAALDLKKLQFQKKILAYYPIQFSKQTRLAGDLTADELFEKFVAARFRIPLVGWQFSIFLPWKQPIMDVRDYAGEKIALYFAFLEFYSFWLIPIACLGLIVYIIQIFILSHQTGSGNIITQSVKVIQLDTPLDILAKLNSSDKDVVQSGVDDVAQFVLNEPFTSELTPFAISLDKQSILYNLVPTEVPLLVPLYALVIAFWGAFFLEFWKRHQAALAYRWGVSDYERHAEVRAEFKSEFDVPDVVTGLPTPYRSPVIFGLKVGFSLSAVGSAVMLTVAAFAGTYIFKAFMSQSGSLDPTLATQLALVVNAGGIMVLATVFKTVARNLTNWENHRTDIEYEDMLIGKTFVFSFFNSYTTLLYFAFVKKGQDLPPGGQTQYCVADLTDLDKDNVVNESGPNLYADEDLIKVDSCYGALGYSLTIIFIVQIFVSNAIEMGTPLLKNLFKSYTNNVLALKEKTKEFGEDRLKNLKDGVTDLTSNLSGQGYHDNEEKAPEPDDEEKNKQKGKRLKSPAEVQYLLQPYVTPFDDYLEIALQFGYVTLFVAAFPLAPTLALLNNCIEVWVDSKKVCKFSRRPNLPRAQDIGTWLYIFTVLSYVAIVTNAGVLVFTSVEIIPIKIEQPENRVWVFLGFIIGVFGVKYLTDFFILDVPARIKIQLERQKHIEQKIFYDDEDDLDKYVAIAEVKARDSADQTAENLTEFKVLAEDPYLLEVVDEFRMKLKNHQLDEDKLFRDLDKNHNGMINLSELKQALLGEDIGFGKQMEPFAVKLVVDALDSDGDGTITRSELKSFLNEEGQRATGTEEV